MPEATRHSWRPTNRPGSIVRRSVYQDAAGRVWLSYNNPSWIAQRHGLGAAVTANVQALVVKERGVIYTTIIVADEGYAKVLGQNLGLTDIEHSCGDAQVIASWTDLAKIREDWLPLYARLPPRFTEKAVVLANLNACGRQVLSSQPGQM